MKLIIIFLAMILLSSAVYADISKDINYNLQDLPVTSSISFNFSLQPNSTIFFQQMLNNSKVSLQFPANITLNENNSIANFIVNYTIPFFAEYNTSVTTLPTTIATTNTINSNIFLINLNFVIATPPPINNNTNQTNITPSMTMLDNGKVVEIQSFTASEFNRTHLVTILGTNGTNLTITCGSFLTCPTNLTIPQSGTVNITAKIYIPKGQLPGNYTSFFRVKALNVTSEITFRIFVSGEDIYNIILYDIWNQTCYDSAENLANCYKLQAKYNADVANALIERLRAGNMSAVCGNATITNQLTKYVEVGNVDPQLYQSYQTVLTKYNQLVTNYNQISNENHKCIVDKANIQVDVEQRTAVLETEFAKKQQDLIIQNELTKDKDKQKLRTTFEWILGLILIVLLGFIMLGMYLESNWAVQHFPKIPLMIVWTFLLMTLILIAIYLR
jgi:hypothetical protein